MKLTPLLFTSLFCVISLSASKPASVQDIALKDIDGKSTSLKAYAGKVVLMVNVASECGLTRQYRSMESIYRKYKARVWLCLVSHAMSLVAKNLVLMLRSKPFARIAMM